MKPLTYLAISIILLLGCSKNQEKTVNNVLFGKWKLTEVLISPGSIGTWEPFVSTEPVIIKFKSAGQFEYSPNFPKANLRLDRYILSGDTIKLTSLSTGNSDTWNLRHIDNSRLDISIYMYFEPCGHRFIKLH